MLAPPGGGGSAASMCEREAAVGKRTGTRWLVALGVVAGLALAGRGDVRWVARAAQEGDCSAAIGPRTVVDGHSVGPEVCVIREERTIENASGVPYPVWRSPSTARSPAWRRCPGRARRCSPT